MNKFSTSGRFGNINDFKKNKKENIKNIVAENRLFQTAKGWIKNDKKNNTLLNSSPIRIKPENILLNDIKINQSYEITISVFNLTKNSRKIRVIQPESSKFRCDYKMVKNLAPGIHLNLNVTFMTNKSGEIHDKLIVKSDDYQMEIPLHAYTPIAKIKFDPFINLGYIQCRELTEKEIVFENIGLVDGKIDLKNSNPNLIIEPLSFIIPTNSYQKVKLSYYPKEPGIYRGIIDVCVEGLTFSKYIDINATAVDFMLFLVDQEGNEFNDINFGEGFFGIKQNYKCYLINNSPEKVDFKLNIIQGYLKEYDEKNNLKTPAEYGLEQVEKVINCNINEGTIDSYSQYELIFSCKSNVKEDQLIWVRNYSMLGKSQSDSKISKNEFSVEHEYTAVFSFEGTDEIKNIPLNALSICPKVKISNNYLNFGECYLNERKDIQILIENNHNFLPIFISTKNYSNYIINPKEMKINGDGYLNCCITFKPKTLGSYSDTLIFYINRNFEIYIKTNGYCINSKNKKLKKIRGPMATLEHFLEKPNYILQNNKVTKNNNYFRNLNTVTNDFKQLNTNENNDNFKTYIKKKENEKVYIEAMRKTNNRFIIKKDVNKRKNIFSPKIKVPEIPDTLYVEKPIANHEPYSINNKGFKFNPDMTLNFKEFPEKADNHIDIRSCNSKLDGINLQRIHVGPMVLDFGKIFIRSESYKYFQIKNELRNAILGRIIIDSIDFKNSYWKPQIIPSGKIAGFKIVLCSEEKKKINQTVKYIINERNEFKFLVKAKIIPVELQLSTGSVKFQFDDESVELETSREISLTNTGNSRGYFSWNIPENSPFKVNIMEGYVESNSYIHITITFCPSGNKLEESEVLYLDVKDGGRQSIKCIGNVKESKYEFIKQVINWDTIPVSHVENDYFTLKNIHPQNYLIFKIDTSNFPENLKIQPLKGKITPDENQRFDITYFSDTERDDLTKGIEIPIMIRGGKIINAIIKVAIIVPKVIILEDEINFGNVTTGNTETFEITIKNNSSIASQLYLDLNEKTNFKEKQKGIKLLDIEFLNKNEDESIVIEEKNPYDLYNTKNIDNFKSNRNMDIGSEVESEDNNEIESSRIYIINLKPNKTYHFLLKFTPELEKLYAFELPISLAGEIKTDGLRKWVKCNGISSKLIMNPSNGILEFKKQIISSLDSINLDIYNIEFYNPSNFSVEWNLDITDIENEKVFSILPTSGTIEPKSNFALKAVFKPVLANFYERRIPIYVSNDFSKPYLEIKLKGEGACPKILFDRREIILPIVPLGIKSETYFKIINDGYKNMSFKCSKPQDLGAIDLKVDFIEGNIIGGNSNNSNKLKILISFISNKHISFTTKLDFEDEQRNIYSIFVSGTTDNCLLTNYHFLNLNIDSYEISTCNNKNPRLIEKENTDDLSETINNKSVNISKVGSFISKSGKSSLGHTPKNMKELERSSQHIKKWINEFVLDSDINKFPGDIIQQNGIQVFELLEFLTKKNNWFKVKFEGNIKKQDKIQKLIQQYDSLIMFLIESGALLNTIRPEYLLSYNDFLLYIKKNTKNNVLPNVLRVSENKFKYISHDAWNTLFYQILKIFYLNRITVKRFKQYFSDDKEIQLIPDYFNEKSNLYSTPELILLRWLEIIYQKTNKTKDIRLKNFDTDVKNGILISNSLQFYIGNTINLVKNLKTSIFNNDDFKYNLEKMKYVLVEYGLMNVLDLNNFLDINPREIILFLCHLFFILPNYIPKQTIEFNCLLNEKICRNIAINNPNKKSIFYMIKLEAHKDFEIENDYIKIESGQTINFPIYFKPSISNTVNGKIFFKNRKDAGTIGEVLVFDLKSNVTGRKSKVIREVPSIELYLLGTSELEIQNTFNYDAEFLIKLENLNNYELEDKEKKNNKKMKSKNNKKNKKKKNNHIFVPSFFCKQDKIRIKAGSYNKITIYYLPITYEKHTCHIILCDERVGEIQYEVFGKPRLPNPINKFHISDYIDSNLPQEIPIQPKNIMLKEALYLLEEKSKELRSESFKEQVNNLLELLNELKKNNIYEIEITPNISLFNFPSTFNFPENESSDNKITETNYILKLIPQYKNIFKDFYMNIIIKNQYKTDIRIIDVVVNVNPKKIKATLEFNTNVGIPIEQNIPLLNPLDKNNNAKISFTDIRNGINFKFENIVSLPKSSKINFPLIFNPNWVGVSEGKLHIKNQATHESFEYELIGKAEEPLALDHFEVLAKVNQEKILKINLENENNYPLNYRVECDLNNCEYPSNILIKPNSDCELILKIKPKVGGEYLGSITLYLDDEKFIWYTINLKVESLRSEKTLQITTTIRKGVICDIKINNTFNEPLEYKVNIEGEGLHGRNLIKINPNQTYNYELRFIPFKVFKDKGCVSFYNERFGELWYEIFLISEESEPIKLPTIKAELGKTETYEIVLENFSNKDTKVKTEIKNNLNFSVNKENFVIQARSSVGIMISYMPSNLEKLNSGTITFISDNIGKWTYLVYGIGEPPTKFPIHEVKAFDKQDISSTILFKNPFKDDVVIIINLKTEEKEIFDLLLKKNIITLKGLTSIQIPFSFKPLEIKEYNAELNINMNEKINWVYPIKGTAESAPFICPNKSYDISVRCKEKKEQLITFNLNGITNIDENEKFGIYLSINNKEFEKILKKWFVIIPKKNYLESIDDYLSFWIKFEPLKPFKVSGEYIIIKPSGGRWRYKFQIESLEGEFDEIIHITSNLNITSKIKFKVYNNNSRNSSVFKAEFSHDSASEFSIKPTCGKLEPLIKDGTEFVISFTPVEYGKLKIGKLVIQTEQLYKIFKIIGTFPQYKPPKGKESSYSKKNLNLKSKIN